MQPYTIQAVLEEPIRQSVTSYLPREARSSRLKAGGQLSTFSGALRQQVFSQRRRRRRIPCMQPPSLRRDGGLLRSCDNHRQTAPKFGGGGRCNGEPHSLTQCSLYEYGTTLGTNHKQ